MGFFYNWEQLRDLAAPGSTKISACYGEAHLFESDQKVADAAIAALQGDVLDFVFVYFGHPDEAGHAHGWMTEPYLKAIENADACLAQVLEHWDGMVCVVSDHGGHARSHGTDCAEDMTIPFILHGPGIAAGRELTEPVFLYDVCPTLAHALGIPACREWEGRIVVEAFE